MFSRIAALITVAIAATACARMERHARRANAGTGTNTVSQCDTGNIQCCNNVANATDLSFILDLLSYSYDPADSVGLDCIPINTMGAGESAGCQQQPVCCSNNNESGFINIGCSPFDLN